MLRLKWEMLPFLLCSAFFLFTLSKLILTEGSQVNVMSYRGHWNVGMSGLFIEIRDIQIFILMYRLMLQITYIGGSPLSVMLDRHADWLEACGPSLSLFGAETSGSSCSGINSYSVHICMMQQCCIIVITMMPWLFFSFPAVTVQNLTWTLSLFWIHI